MEQSVYLHPPAMGCDARLNAFCNSNASRCSSLAPRRGVGGRPPLPLLARFGRSATRSVHEWRCYAPHTLDENGTRYIGGTVNKHEYCSVDSGHLREELAACQAEANCTTEITKAWLAAPSPLLRAPFETALDGHWPRMGEANYGQGALCFMTGGVCVEAPTRT